MIIGDFNSITSLDEHKGSNFQYYAKKAALFNDFISVNSLIDAGFSGSNFSWYSVHQGWARRWALLERCLVNPSWLSYFNTLQLKYLPKIFSNHSPMFLKMSHSIGSYHKIFCFENYWLEYANYIFAIINALLFKPHSNPMNAFYQLLIRVRSNVLSIKQYGLGALEKEIKIVESQIQALEVNHANSILYNSTDVRIIHNKYRAFLRQNHNRWA